MGYSILQLPIMLQFFLKKLEDMYHNLKSRVYPNQILSFQSSTKEDAASISDKKLSMTEMEIFEANIKSSFSKLDDKVEFIQEKLLDLELRLPSQ